MIIAKELRWSNMFSFGSENVIKFDQERVVQLVGDNGAGKSSIALILEEVLYNKNSKGKKKASILNRYVKDNKYTAEFTFTKGSDEYLIKLVRTSTQKVELFKNGEDISGHTSTQTYKIIQDLIGIDHSTFTQIVYKSGAAAVEFLTSSDSVRKKFLIDLLNLNKYIQIGDIFKDKQSSLNKKLAEVNASINTIKSFIDKHKDFSFEEKELLDVPTVDNSLKDKVIDLKATLSNISEANKNITTNNKYKKMLEGLMVKDLPTKPSANTDEILGKIGAIDKDTKNRLSALDRWKKLGHVCPTCNSELDTEKMQSIIDEYTNIINENNKEYTILSEELSNIRSEIDKYNKILSNNKEYEKIRASINESLPEELHSEDSIKKELLEIQSKLEETEKEISNIIRKNTQIEKENNKAKFVLEKLEEYNSELNTEKLKLDAVNEEISINNILVKTFSTTGLVAYKIEGLVKDLEDTCNDYLTRLSNGRFQILFQLAGNDKLNCVIIDNSNEIEVVDLSSGELSIVSTSLILGIRRLMQQLTNTSINILFLDEVIAYLSNTAKDKLIEILLEEPKLNTFFIAHGYDVPLVHKMYLIKTNNISRIEE